ncbi:MAG: glycosyltransferase family 2 protein [Pseudomonadota bacterium]|nr:glycosyltransferase family 2 protein [Pseudomonadota bacterium]
MKSHFVVDKYLERHAEREIVGLKAFTFQYSHVVTIPAFDEEDKIWQVLDSIQQKSTLAILVINAQANSAISSIEANIRLIKTLHRQHCEIWRSTHHQGISLHQTKTCAVLLIDRTSGNLLLPPKTGVGLARKIAADVALQLIVQGSIRTPWIHCTDADTLLPNDYFKRTLPITDAAAAIYPYSHILTYDNSPQQKAIQLYELSLRHYVIGLHHAGSKYAFSSIGSTIAINYIAYAKVHGFPIREAGEDFYILNKLAKVGAVKQLAGLPIIIEGRLSHRVPFGTGKAIHDIAQLRKPLEEYCYYHPTIFDILKTWLGILNNITPKTAIPNLKNSLSQSESTFALCEALDKIGAFSAIDQAINNASNAATCRQHLHIWFDGFRTMKLVHQLRNDGLSSIPLAKLIREPLYQCLGLNSLPPIEQLCDQFNKLQTSFGE